MEAVALALLGKKVSSILVASPFEFRHNLLADNETLLGHEVCEINKYAGLSISWNHALNLD